MLPEALFVAGLIAMVVSGIVAIFALRAAPEGFQDVNGFHFIVSVATPNSFSGEHQDTTLIA